MTKESRMGLIAAAVVAGVLLIVVAIVAPMQRNAASGGIDRRGVIEAMTSNSNGVVLFNKQGKVLVLNGHEYYDCDHAMEMYSIARIKHRKLVDSMGPDTYVGLLPRGVGNRWTESYAEDSITDWMKQGTAGERNKKR